MPAAKQSQANPSILSAASSPEPSRKTLAELLKKHREFLRRPQVGDIVQGKILEKGPRTLYIDLGSLGVGVVYGRELFDSADTFEHAKPGDPVEAAVIGTETDEGFIELSLRSASRERSWEEILAKEETGAIFETEILDANRGGLIVRVHGITGFLPVSQLAPEHYPRVEGGQKQKIFERLRTLIGKKLKVKIISADPEREKVIVSEKAALGDTLHEALEKLKQGAVVEGKISGVADFGAFLKFPYAGQELEGLIHISEIAWERVDNPADYLKVGQKVKAKVIGVEEGTRISLSIKQLRPDPWKTIKKKIKVGDEVEGVVTKITPFGGFVRLNEDVHGLVHVSELSTDVHVDPHKILKIGERRKFKVITLVPSERRLGLSLIKLKAAPRRTAKSARAPKAAKKAAGIKKKTRVRATKKARKTSAQTRKLQPSKSVAKKSTTSAATARAEKKSATKKR
jgi:small subunit ribosomal protein S1